MLTVADHLAGQGKEPPQSRITDRVRDLAATALSAHETAPAQAGEMIRYTALGSPEFGDKLGNIPRLAKQEPYDGKPRRLAKHTEKARVSDGQRCGFLSCAAHPQFTKPPTQPRMLFDNRPSRKAIRHARPGAATGPPAMPMREKR